MSTSTLTTLSTMSPADVAAHAAASHVKPSARVIADRMVVEVARWEREDQLSAEARAEYELAAAS